MKSLLIVFSYHHNNTQKIAEVIAKILHAKIKTPEKVEPEVVQEYTLIGFGSGIYSAKHHKSLIDLADKLPTVHNKKAFIFSTSGITGKDKVIKDHLTLKEKLQSKGFVILDDFQCKGYNTNSFLRFFGGMNKGRPNDKDLENAKNFAKNLKQN
ncbi:MAG: flavodoxin [miscellaneous Crenarchaeota group-6 archaeon AD8-1]|nr:MAG: flavodoxin [miscellaneous Crenarchaeota group-6 archaeon AD8-1]